MLEIGKQEILTEEEEPKKKNLYEIYKEEMERRYEIKKIFNMKKMHNFTYNDNEHLVLKNRKEFTPT